MSWSFNWDVYEANEYSLQSLPRNGGEFTGMLKHAGTRAQQHGNLRYADIPSMTPMDSTSFQNGRQGYVVRQSVNVSRARPKSAIFVTRSQSFNLPMAASQKVQKDGGAVGLVLGDSFRQRGSPHAPVYRNVPGIRGAAEYSFRKLPRVPKVPRPNRALLMFQSVKRGVKEYMEATKEDINQLLHREMDRTSTTQKIKAAKRFLERLEFHSAKLEEMHENYLFQQQLREGVRTMHRAYVTLPGNQNNTLLNVKYGYKECSQTMCDIEAQLEMMMGTFHCKLKGMAGFARLCPGDVFKVTVWHGDQKWKTKGRIEKSGNQKWDVPEFTFKAEIGDVLNIKGLELRAFRSILLGQKCCETKDLFSASPQLMTVSINVNGSLKLSIVITWNPLDGIDESVYFEVPTKVSVSPLRRPVPVTAFNGHGQYNDLLKSPKRYSDFMAPQQTANNNFILCTNNTPSYLSIDSPLAKGSLLSDLPNAYQQTDPVYTQMSDQNRVEFPSSPVLLGDADNNKTQFPLPPTHFSSLPNLFSPLLNSLHFPGVMANRHTSAMGDGEHSVLNIEDVLHTLSLSLDDYHGQYMELQKLEDLLKDLNKLIRKRFRSRSHSSSVSVSIEHALEAFDFLNMEEITEEPLSPTNPESTAKTGDSGIESLAQRLSEDTQLGSSLGSSPVPPSTGNEEVDQCLLYHLTYCERMLENIGAFGPLRCREIYTLDKIEKQCTIIESLIKLAKTGTHMDLHSVMSSLCADKSLREFWAKCTDHSSLYIQPDRLVTCLEQKFTPVIASVGMDPGKVCQHVLTRVLDIPDYEAEKGQGWFVVTLHQFMLYFNEEGGLRNVEDVAKELQLVEKLMSGNADTVIKSILMLRDTLPSSPCLKVIGMLLVTMDTTVEQCILSYLTLIQKTEFRNKAIVTFVEGLEDKIPEIRGGACKSLAILEATESIDQLVYLWQSDSSSLVQKFAKDALLSMDAEGRKAFEEAQLSKHGFQGLQVHK